MTDHEKMLDDIFSASEEIYKDMSDDVCDTDHSKVFEYITRLGKTLSGSENTCFWKWDRRTHTLRTTSAEGEKISVPEDTGLVGRAIAEKRVIISDSPVSELVLPVADVNGEFIGAYQARNKPDGGGFGAEDCRRLSLAAVICGLALESEVFLDVSQRDRLTQLMNRMGFYRDMSRRYLRTAEGGGKLGLMICDIDYFKQINDTYGHNAGDEVLRHTAGILSACCREGDGVYRWGGEEFIMIIGDADRETCIARAEEIRGRVKDSVCRFEGVDIKCTMSFGIAEYDPAMTVEENISAADSKLYTAKESGRDRVVG